MAKWRVQVADVYTITVEADTEDEACAAAKHGNELSSYDEQRIVAIHRVFEEGKEQR